MRTAYVNVYLGDPEDREQPSFSISSVPFLYRELLMPAEAKMYGAESYSELCAVLRHDFKIPESMLPPAKYFKPTKTEREDEWRLLSRTVPEGAGEPEWRIKARQALLDAVDEASGSLLENGKATVNGKDYFSIEELRHELETIAEQAGGKKRRKGEAYQPDYDVLVKEALARDPYLLHNSDLPKIRKPER